MTNENSSPIRPSPRSEVPSVREGSVYSRIHPVELGRWIARLVRRLFQVLRRERGAEVIEMKHVSAKEFNRGWRDGRAGKDPQSMGFAYYKGFEAGRRARKTVTFQ